LPSPKTIEELILPIEMASKTRLLAFSHISNTSGIGLPAKELCSLAREKGILTRVDGAQSFGMMDLDLKDRGCDF
ncbi:MAG: aminotransferase, partial [Marivirga sp.]|nr:aminotransferase [Marivirga sp.]